MTEPRAPTDKQLATLRFIHECMREHGLPPSVREICDHIGATSTNAGHCVLEALVKKGLVKRRFKIARGATLTAEGYLAVAGVQRPVPERQST